MGTRSSDACIPSTLHRARTTRHSLPRPAPLRRNEFVVCGIDVRTVSGRLGQANAPTTFGTYAHFVGAAYSGVAEILGSAVKRSAVKRSAVKRRQQ